MFNPTIDDDDDENMSSVIIDLQKEIQDISYQCNQQKNLLFDKEHDIAEINDKYTMMETIYLSDIASKNKDLLKKQNELYSTKQQLEIMNHEYHQEQERCNLMQSEGMKRIFLLQLNKQELTITQEQLKDITDKYKDVTKEYDIQQMYLEEYQEKLRMVELDYKNIQIDYNDKVNIIKQHNLEKDLNDYTKAQEVMTTLVLELPQNEILKHDTDDDMMGEIKTLKERKTSFYEPNEMLLKDNVTTLLHENELNKSQQQITIYYEEKEKLKLETASKDIEYNNNLNKLQSEIQLLHKNILNLQNDVVKKDNQLLDLNHIQIELINKNQLIDTLQKQIVTVQQTIDNNIIEIKQLTNQLDLQTSQYNMITKQLEESNEMIEVLQLELKQINCNNYNNEILLQNKNIALIALVNINELNKSKYQQQITIYFEEKEKLKLETASKDIEYNNNLNKLQSDVQLLQIEIISQQKKSYSLDNIIRYNNNHIISLNTSAQDMKDIINELKKGLTNELLTSQSQSNHIIYLEDQLKLLHQQLLDNQKKHEDIIVLKDFDYKNYKIEITHKLQNKSKLIHQYQQDLTKVKQDMDVLQTKLNSYTNAKFYKTATNTNSNNNSPQNYNSLIQQHTQKDLEGITTTQSPSTSLAVVVRNNKNHNYIHHNDTSITPPNNATTISPSSNTIISSSNSYNTTSCDCVDNIKLTEQNNSNNTITNTIKDTKVTKKYFI